LHGVAWDAVVFDLDGVLVDSRPGIAVCIDHALRAHGLKPLLPGAVERYIGPPLRDGFEAMLREQGADPALADASVTEFRARYRDECVTGTTAQPGVDAVVRAVADHTPLAVATSKPVDFARAILEHLGLAECFVSIAGPSLLGPESETKTVTLRRALADLAPAGGGGEPDTAAIVGDRSHDVEAGRALGLTTIGVTWGFGSDTELRDADHLVRTPAELAALLGASPVTATG
jgi:phosphoglycolate phosphatase